MFRNLYSLNVFQSTIQGLDNKKLTELASGEAEDLEKRKDKNPSGTGYEDSYIDPDAPEVKQLRHTIKKVMHEHIDPRLNEAEIWAHVLRTGESTMIHSHKSKDDWGHGNISWVYYPHIPEGKNNGGKIVFQTQIGAIKTLSKDFDPEVGDFIIFPAWLPHFTTRNVSPEARVSISGNYRVEGVNYDQDMYNKVINDDRSGIKKLTGFLQTAWPRMFDADFFNQFKLASLGDEDSTDSKGGM